VRPYRNYISRQRINVGFGTGGVAQEGFGTVLVQFDPKLGLKAGSGMDVQLEDALESISTSSRGVAQPGSAPALGAHPSLPTVPSCQFCFHCSQQFGESASRSKLTRKMRTGWVLVQFCYSPFSNDSAELNSVLAPSDPLRFSAEL